MNNLFERIEREYAAPSTSLSKACKQLKAHGLTSEEYQKEGYPLVLWSLIQAVIEKLLLDYFPHTHKAL